MAIQRLHQEGRFRGPLIDQPLLGIPLHEEGQEVVCYFAEEGQADATVPLSATQEALRLAGAWHDLDWDTMEQALHCIRHESPTVAATCLMRQYLLDSAPLEGRTNPSTPHS